MEKKTDNKNSNTIIGRIYDEIFKSIRLDNGHIINTERFMKLCIFGDGDVNSKDQTWSDLRKYAYVGSKINKVEEFLSNKKQCVDNIGKILWSLNEGEKQRRNENLIDIVGDSKNNEYRQRLYIYFELTKENFDLYYNIYLTIYCTILNKLPDNFFYGHNYEANLKDYNDKVTKIYSSNSYGGRIAIRKLAESGNIIALHEYADMLYYGTYFNNKPDYNKAFLYYKISAGIGKSIFGEQGGVCNPLALWSLAYIYFNYAKKEKEWREIIIDELDSVHSGNKKEMIKIAIDYCKKAIALNQEFGPADNLLGNITKYILEDAIEYNELISELKTPEIYYSQAVEKKYLFAYSNLAGLSLKKLFASKIRTEKFEKECLNEAIRNYEALYDKCGIELEACNELALIYLKGRNEYKELNIDINEIVEGAKEKAHNLLINCTSGYIEKRTVWPIVNRICFFPKDYQNDITLLEEHLNIVYSYNLPAQIKFLEENAKWLNEGMYSGIFEAVKEKTKRN